MDRAERRRRMRARAKFVKKMRGASAAEVAEAYFAAARHAYRAGEAQDALALENEARRMLGIKPVSPLAARISEALSREPNR